MSDHEDYAHVHDAQSQRTRREMWVILAVVVAVIAGALIWRAVAHVPAKPQKGWDMHNTLAAPNASEPGAAAGIRPAPAAPRPAPAP